MDQEYTTLAEGLIGVASMLELPTIYVEPEWSFVYLDKVTGLEGPELTEDEILVTASFVLKRNGLTTLKVRMDENGSFKIYSDFDLRKTDNA